MKNKKIFYLLFVLFYAKTLMSQSKEIVKYYEYVNNAELLVIKDSFTNANSYYKMAFDINKKPFAIDIYNATIIAMASKQYDLVIMNMTRLLKLGYDIENFKTNKMFLSFWKSKYGTKMKQIKKITRPFYNRKYRNILLHMYEKDQHFRIKPNSYKLYDDTIRKIDKQNVRELQYLIKRFGFPSEYKIGLYSDDVTTHPYEIIIIHQSSGPYQIFNFSSIIRSAILSGEIDNKTGAELIKRNDGVNYFDDFNLVNLKFDTVKVNIDSLTGLKDTVAYTFESGWGFFNIMPEQLEKYNQMRKTVMLESLEDFLQKVQYAEKNPILTFKIKAAKNTFSFSSYNDFLHAKGNLKLIE